MNAAPEKQTKAGRRRVFLGLALFVGGLGLLALMQTRPIHSTLSNCLILTGGTVILAGGFLATWRWRPIRWVFVICVATTGALFLLPGRPTNVADLRAKYIASLQSFEGTQYVWGGEARNGVDCSGLPRRAWREALFNEGLATLNGHLLRAAFDSWWNDASARELGEGAGGRAVPIGDETTITKISTEKLHPGDLAVTASGIHLLVYFGAGKWIEADPTLHRVIIFDPLKDKNDWSNAPVRICRWTEIN